MTREPRLLDSTLAHEPAGHTRARPELEPSELELRQGALIGRYVALAKLGAGAMGVVWAAYDPELDRKLAIKLLAPRGDNPDARARLQREAQALARLDHRNVVVIHDVGMHGGRLFIAMEYVAGRTLTEWLRAGERSWRDVLAVFIDAGRGLAAAHAAGLIHRDFKPDNVMLGEDGRVRVMDFGLARAEHEQDDREQSPRSPRTAREASLVLTDKLTQTGALMGTPAYMSLEQLEGHEVDARSDQFSFCVALYEALHGERPFAAHTLTELFEALAAERLREPTRGAKVPGWLHAVVVRGLATAPQRRWPSMQALLDALADDPAKRRRKWWMAAALVGLLGGASWGMAALLDAEARVCEHMDDKLRGVWDEARRAEVRAALLATELSYATGTWERVERHLDDYTRAWVEAREQACEATHEGEQSSELLDLRMACLDRRLLYLRATIDELAQADARVVPNAVEAVLDLPRLERCADVDALLAEVPPPDDPALAEQVAALDDRLVEAEAKQNSGRYDEGIRLVEAVVAEADALAYEPLQVRAWLRLGVLQHRLGRSEPSAATLERAMHAALAQRMRREAALASADLIFVVGYLLGRPAEARRVAALADSLARASGLPEARAWHLNNLGAVLSFEGDYAGAREHFEAALVITEQELGPEHPKVAICLYNLGFIASTMGDLDEARAHHERALAIRRRTLGPAHPDMGYSLLGLGQLALASDDHERAREQLEHALTIFEASLGREHPAVVTASLVLGEALVGLGRPEVALVHLERTLTIRATASDPRELAEARLALADVLWQAPPERGRDRPRALELARLAKTSLAAAGLPLAEVDAWLSGHVEE